MSRLPRAALLGFLIGIAGVLLSFFHFAHEIEDDVGLGLLFKLRGVRKPPADVVVVSIDRESADYLKMSDNPERWPRLLHARLVEKLAREGARVIVFDLYFIDPHSDKEDRSLAEALRKARNVVLAEQLKARAVPSSDVGGSYAGEHTLVKILKPIALLSQAAVATAPFVLPRLPVKVNQYWTFQTGAGDSPTFPVVAFQLYALPVYDEFVRLFEKVTPNHAGELPRDAGAAIQTRGAVKFIRDIREIFESDPSIAQKMIGELEQSGLIARDANRYRLLKSLVKLHASANRRYLNYYGPPRTLITIPYYQISRFGEGSGSAKRLDLKGKAVFVGLSEMVTEKRDSFYTVFSQANGVFISGVEIAATAFANLLDDTAVKPLNSQSYLLIILAWGILVGVVCGMAPTVVAALAIIGVSLLYLLAVESQFAADGTWYPVVIPLFFQSPGGFFTALLWNYFATNKERQNIRKALGYYVPDEVVDELVKNIVDMKRGGQTVYGACLFTDAAGYTSLSETVNPRELRDFMHKYFEVVFEPIRQNGGLVLDLEGDSILAIWKGAGPEPALGKQACLAALGVARAVSRFNRSFETLKLPVRVGVHAGQIFLGNIGAGDHYRYGATGDTINTAARMDSLNKHLGTEILVSEDVMAQLDGFLTREAGRFQLKGKTHPVVVHELLCRMEESEEKQKKACAIFSEALRAFREQSWEAAQEKFHQSIKHSGENDLARFYLKLCAEYQKNPPEGPWEGVIPMEEK
jgi:adenylate cyclase